MTFPIEIGDFNITFQDTEIIRFWESHSLDAYLCPAGKWTISWGITGSDVYEGLTITQAQSEQMFSNKIEFFACSIYPLIQKKINKEQFIALLSFAYNAGVASLRSSTLLKKLNAGVISEVPQQFLKWKYATINGKKVILRGLVKRRLSESELFRLGELRFNFPKNLVDKHMKV